MKVAWNIVTNGNIIIILPKSEDTRIYEDHFSLLLVKYNNVVMTNKINYKKYDMRSLRITTAYCGNDRGDLITCENQVK